MQVCFRYLIILPYIFCTFNLYAQNLIPTPQTWDFQALGRVPINQYTGRLDFNVPIYEYKDKDFNIPISVSYNSAGFSPSKPAGIVGLNWALNVGGIITRKVNGVPDEIMAGEGSYSSNGLYYGTDQIKVDCDNDSIFYFGSPGTWSINSYNQLDFFITDPEDTNNKYEARPDEFEFNFMGHHGKFKLDLNGNVVVYDCDDGESYIVDMTKFRSEYSTYTWRENMDSSEIIITTNDGYKYYFGGDINSKEFSCASSTESETNERPLLNEDNCIYSTWNISKIVAPNERQVEFSYMPLSYSDAFSRLVDIPAYPVYSNLQETNSDRKDLKFWIANEIPMEVTEGFINHPSELKGLLINIPGTLTGGSGSYWYWQYTKTSYLENIIVDGDTLVDIVYSLKEYKDLADNSCSYKNLKVDTILVKNSNGDKIKTASFTYEYDSDRMFLEAININGYEEYGFTYDNIGNLPGYTTKNIDHWGFWTGLNTQDPSLVPDIEPGEEYEIGDECVIKRKVVEGFQEIGSREPHQSTNLSFSQAGMLTIITYPTGGSTEIAYEPHTYRRMVDRRSSDLFFPTLYTYEETELYYNNMLPENSSTTTYTPYGGVTLYAGGVRVKSIKDYDGSNYINMREFSYTDDFDGDDSGILLYFPRYQYFLSSGLGTEINATYTSGICTNCYDDHICYSSVIESDYKGYIRSDFSDISSSPDDNTQYALILGALIPVDLSLNLTRYFNSHNTERGKLLKQTIFNSNKDTVQSTEYKYKAIDENDYITSIKGTLSTLYSYKNYVSACPIIKKTVRNFSTTGDFINEQVTSYSYNDFGLRSSISTINSKGETINKKFLYPTEYPNVTSGFIDEMQTANIVNKPIEQYTSKDNKVVNGILTTYKTGSEVGLIDKTYILETESPLLINSVFFPSNYQGIYSKSEYPNQAEVSYDRYDDQGNLLQFHKSYDNYVSYIWGYNNTYPIAKIENATYGEIETALGGVGFSLDGEGGNNLSSSQQASLKNGLPKALITFFSYKPLIGISSITDPKGLTTTYHYDDFGRLEEIRDHDNKILQLYEYHYATQTP